MGRSSGYRPNKACAEEVNKLRSELAKVRGDQWQKANAIMREITDAMGRRGGPMGAVIQPRVCKHCGYYGHTRQHCAKRKEHDMQACADAVSEHERTREEYDSAARLWARENKGRSSQAEIYEQLGIEWDWHPAGIGAFPKWYLEERTVTMSEHAGVRLLPETKRTS